MTDILLSALASELDIDRTTMMRWAKKNATVMETINRSRGKGSGQKSFAISMVDAEKARADFSECRLLPVTKLDVRKNCVFYMIQIVPDLNSNRIKLGFTEDIDQRVRSYKTTLPTLNVVKTWSCLPEWEKAAIASATRIECEFLGLEVIQCDDYESLLDRCNQFFDIMPSLS